MTELEKMLAQACYDPCDLQLTDMRVKARLLVGQYNATKCQQKAERSALLHQLLGHCGQGAMIEPHFNCDYGQNIHVGDNFYMNFAGVILNCATVTIGDNCFIGPQVGIYTACHPINPVERNSGVEFARPINIGNNCWIGGHATIMPGVTLGDNVVVGAGAVVTKDVADNLIVAGNPARIIKSVE
ncbi:sugar O-acetyltransferase [Shewanella waksmanii]|uniref:sugar O-acetyltransferase n=1 Tax=Shewanella waksmanii TaxID=213783 RepID=UPI00048C9BC2|nr:sugar O-acetyltransferase [Shewanella waksmanii]